MDRRLTRKPETQGRLCDDDADADLMSTEQGLLGGLLAAVRGWFGDGAEETRHKARL